MSTKHIATAQELGTSFARLALREASDVASFAESVKGVKAHEDFKVFDQFRTEFKDAARAAGYEDADSLWSRTWRAAKAFGMLGEFPKAQSEAATKKAAQREQAKAALSKMVEGKTAAELLVASSEALKEGDASQAAALLSAAQKAKADADKAAKDAAREATKKQVERIRAVLDRLVKAGDVAKLTKLAAAAEKLSPVPKD